MPIEEAIFQEIKQNFELELLNKEKALQKRKQVLEQEIITFNKKREEARINYIQKLSEEKDKMEQEIKTKTQLQFINKLNRLQEELDNKDKKISEIEELKVELLNQKKQIEHEKQKQDLIVSQKLNEEKEKIFKEAEMRAENQFSVKLDYLEQQIREKDTQLRLAQKMELDIRKQKKQLEENQESLELEIERRLDEEVKKVRKNIEQQLLKEYQMKDSKMEIYIKTLKREIEELKLRAEQVPSQLVGKALEEGLEFELKNRFILDRIVPVLNGIQGADVIQYVHNEMNQECGKIIWETKNTKSWSNGWIDKLKQDQRESKADIAILLSKTIPNDVDSFKYIDGVWVTTHDTFISLATALRISLIEVHKIKVSMIGQDKKSQIIYEYLCGNEFRQKIEAITETIISMRGNLEREKRAMNKIWSERQKHLDYIDKNTSTMYGDIKGIIGASLLEVNDLQLLNSESNVSKGISEDFKDKRH